MIQITQNIRTALIHKINFPNFHAKMDRSNKTWLVILPVLVGLSLALLAIFYFGADRVEFGDAKDYINSANAILHGTPYPRRGDFHPVFRAPVFPAFIALVWSIFPEIGRAHV